MGLIDWIAKNVNPAIYIGGFFILVMILIIVKALEEAHDIMTYREHVNCRSKKEAEEFIFAVGEKNVYEVVEDGRWIVVYLKEGVHLKEDDCDGIM